MTTIYTLSGVSSFKPVEMYKAKTSLTRGSGTWDVGVSRTGSDAIQTVEHPTTGY